MIEFEIGDIIVLEDGYQHSHSLKRGGEFIVLRYDGGNMTLSGPDVNGWIVKTIHKRLFGESLQLAIDNGWRGWNIKSKGFKKIGNMLISDNCYKCKHACKMKESCPLFEESIPPS